ncbi:MAG: phage protease [Akkermansiaceae bacterium]|jgi:phage I-like protein|nr:phage protease [Akkermansiaceae bacterium]MCU0778692.1 phage protease [Akkermansiaceae bacterium]
MKPKLLNSIFHSLFHARESVENTAALAEVRESDIANSLDPSDAIDFSESADGWFKISPYGTFRGKTPGRQQHVTPESGALMEAEFNSLLGKLGRKFRGVPIYHGHPDVDPEVWTDDRRIGKVTKLESRADGIWGYAEWNSLGEENKREGWWIYPSPRWDQAPGKTRFEPDRLISIGLTNTPRIAESDPVFNSATPDNNDNQTDTTMDPKLIRQTLGLPPEATDEEVMAKIASLTTHATENAAVATELETVKTEKTEMENSLRTKDAEITRLREEQNNSILSEALTSGRITVAERPAWEAKLKSDKRDEEINSLRAIAPARKTQALDLGDRRQERAATDNIREEVSNSVAKLQKDEGLSYSAAWAKVKKEPKFKGYFDRTEG